MRKSITQALSDVSLVVNAGERIALLGPNGSGKSTLLTILTALESVQSGSVRIFGLSPGNIDVRRRVGIVFQSPALDPELSGLENVYLHASLFDIPRVEAIRRTERFLSSFGLKDFGAKRVKHLSGGNRRRIELAKVLVTRPELLILDEPTSGLDPSARQEFWDLISEIHRDNRPTILFSTHLFEEASQASRTVLLSQGRIVADGSPHSLVAELGRDLLSAHTSQPSVVADALRAYGLDPSVLKGRVCASIEKEQLPAIYQRLLPLSSKISIGPPNLEDLYLLKTEAT